MICTHTHTHARIQPCDQSQLQLFAPHPAQQTHASHAPTTPPLRPTQLHHHHTRTQLPLAASQNLQCTSTSSTSMGTSNSTRRRSKGVAPMKSAMRLRSHASTRAPLSSRRAEMSSGARFVAAFARNAHATTQRQQHQPPTPTATPRRVVVMIMVMVMAMVMMTMMTAGTSTRTRQGESTGGKTTVSASAQSFSITSIMSVVVGASRRGVMWMAPRSATRYRTWSFRPSCTAMTMSWTRPRAKVSSNRTTTTTTSSSSSSGG